MMRSVWTVFTSVMVILALVFAMLFVGIRIFGLQPYAVLSGSMEPNFPVGSLLYVKKTDVKMLTVGDVITFSLEGDIVVTHRISGVERDNGLAFRTKGDANAQEDGGMVLPEDIIGTPVFVIPRLGYAAYFIQTPLGVYSIIGGCFLLIGISVASGRNLGEGEKSKTPKRG